MCFPTKKSIFLLLFSCLFLLSACKTTDTATDMPSLEQAEKARQRDLERQRKEAERSQRQAEKEF